MGSSRTAEIVPKGILQREVIRRYDRDDRIDLSLGIIFIL